MKIMKTELLSILPPRCQPLLSEQELTGLQEIRLRVGHPLLLIHAGGSCARELTVTEEDLRFCVNAASRYSPWNALTIRDGYLTAPGGHRIGLCGESAGDTIRTLSSLCIRVCKDLTGLCDHLTVRDSTLIIGPPGTGKTTLLRDLIRTVSTRDRTSVSVVDERCEIFPLNGGKPCFDSGPNTDILSGREKASGINMVLRSMGPTWIAVDEITAEEDCRALLHAGWCGVRLLATAHASDLSDLRSREIYRPLLSEGLFRNVIVMHPDMTCHQERI